MEHLSFPNESAEYRSARIALLDAEIALRRQIEAVAAQRRAGDLVDPLWGLLDMTPEGRGDWFPSLTY